MNSLDQLMQGIALVALLLYLTPIVPQFGISDEARIRLQWAGFVVVAIGIAIALLLAATSWTAG
jgi:hypothetical protein